MTTIDFEKLKKEEQMRQALEIGEWIARRLLENKQSLKTLPPLLYSYYCIWISTCKDRRDNKLFEEQFRGKSL